MDRTEFESFRDLFDYIQDESNKENARKKKSKVD